MALLMHGPQTNSHKARQWIPQKSDQVIRFCHKNATVDHAPDRPPESVHRSSPLASQGLVAPPGLHGFQFQGKGWGWVRWPAKKQKKAIQEVALHIVSPPLGVGGAGVVMFSLFKYGAKQEIETLVHEHEW